MTKTDEQNITDLRKEIIESQKAQSDFIKWKLLIVAGLGSAALGFAGTSEMFGQTEYLFCLIPIVCVYVDLMYLHLTLRILVIGTFLRKYSNKLGSDSTPSIIFKYEHYADTTRNEMGYPNSSFGFEWLAVRGSSLFLSICVIVFGLITKYKPGIFFIDLIEKASLFIVFGCVGFMFTYFIFNIFHHKVKILDKMDFS